MALNETKSLLRSLGFLDHDSKSMDEPTQRVIVLGFEIDSR